MSLSKKQNRREGVHFLLLQGMTETEIAQKLNVSRRTIVRDVSFIRKASHQWVDDLVKDGFNFEAKLAFDKLKECERKLRKLCDEASNFDQKLKATRALQENIMCQTQYLAEGPTLASLNRIVEQYPETPKDQ